MASLFTLDLFLEQQHISLHMYTKRVVRALRTTVSFYIMYSTYLVDFYPPRMKGIYFGVDKR